MKKMILSAIACFALVAASAVAFCKYLDILALLLFVLAIVPSCFFELGRQEYKQSRG